MSDLNVTEETTEQLEVPADEQSQEAVTGTEEATVQESQDHQEPSASKTPEWVQRRFNEMTRDKHEAQRRADDLQRQLEIAQQLAESMQNIEGDQRKPVVKVPGNDNSRIEEAARQIVETQRFNERSNEVYVTGKADYPDFDASLQNLGMLGARPEFFQTIVEMDDAHKVIQALGSGPEEASRILALPPLRQGRELERLASKAAAKPAPKKPVSRAPDPISTIDSSGSRSVDLDNASIDDFMKARNSQSRKR